MATEDYLKQAAAMIRRASMRRRQEANEKSSELIRREKEIKSKIEKLKLQKRRKESVMADAATPNNNRQDYAREEMEIEAEIGRLENELKKEQDKFKKEAGEKEQQERDLVNMAKDIEVRASTL